MVSGIGIGGAFVLQVTVDGLTLGHASLPAIGEKFGMLIGLYLLQALTHTALHSAMIRRRAQCGQPTSRTTRSGVTPRKTTPRG